MNEAPVPPELPNFRVERHLGSGGYADVFLYRQFSPSREVAIKVLKAGLGENVRRQFSDEANAMAELGDHPHIVQVFSVDVTPDGRPYLVMPHYPKDNYAVRAGRERFTLTSALRTGIQVASAVAAAHGAGIVHRDIKPANILTDQWGRPRLADFGIAGRMAAMDRDEDVGMSIPWSPPEILRGEPSDLRADVYSLGATVWHLLTGRSPFSDPHGDNTIRRLTWRIEHAAVPATGRADVPAELDRVLGRAMAKNPAERYPDASAFGLALRQVERTAGLDPTAAEFEADGPARATPLPPFEPSATRLSPLRTVARPVAKVFDTALRTQRPAPESTLVRPRGRTGPPAEHTMLRPTPPEPQSAPVPIRRRWPVLLTAVGVVAVAVVLGIVMFSGGSPAGSPESAPSTVTGNENEQDAGVPGADAPPGQPTVVATRVDDNTIRFTWTYSAQLASDSFNWRTPDGRQSGVAKAPTVDLPQSIGTPLCLQVKVVRADGGHAAADWSPQGCGQ